MNAGQALSGHAGVLRLGGREAGREGELAKQDGEQNLHGAILSPLRLPSAASCLPATDRIGLMFGRLSKNLSMSHILSGLRVIDCGTYIAGPAAAAIMSDFGAEVIKVERPAAGDPYR